MLHHFFDSVTQFIAHHPNWSILIVFLITFTESLPLLGTIIPGSITLTAVGTLVGSGILPATETIGSAVIGAFIGDLLGYKVGVFYDQQIRRIWPFTRYPHWLDAGETFFKKHGGKSIIIGRFIGPVRSSIPMIAGLMKLKLLPFLFAAIPSAILWAILYLLPGLLLGALSLELPPGKATQFLLVGVGIIISAWFIFWCMQRFLMVLNLLTNRLTKRTWYYLQHHKQLKRYLSWIHDKHDPQDHLQLNRVLLAGFCLICFGILAFNVSTNGILTQFNQPLFHLLMSFHTSRLNGFFALFTLLADSHVILGSALLWGFYLLIFKRSTTGWYFLGLAFLAAGATVLFKMLSHSPRPSGLMSIDPSSSFPSGHVLLSTTILGFYAFILARQMKWSLHWIPYTATMILLLLIGLSRLFLGAHWLTDVIGSYFLGSSILLITIVIYLHQQNKNRHFDSQWFYSSLSIILILWIGFGVKDFKSVILEAQPRYNFNNFSMEEWWAHPQRHLQTYRLNRFGQAIAPLNVQWQGSLDSIKTTLKNNGWEKSSHPLNLKNLLKRLTNNHPENHMPLLSPLYHNAKPVLMMIKHLPHSDSILELRLWKAHMDLSDNTEPLWIGIIDFHTPQPRLLATSHKTTLLTQNGQTATQLLTPALKEWQFKWIPVIHPRHNHLLDHLQWDAKLLLIRKRI